MCFWSGPASDLYGPLWKITWILQGDDCNGTEIRLHIINIFIEKMDASRSMQGSIHFVDLYSENRGSSADRLSACQFIFLPKNSTSLLTNCISSSN